MAYGVIGYSQQSALPQPSGSIWGDCSSQELLDEGAGFFTYADFKAVQTLPGLPNVATNSGSFTYDANFDSVINLVTGTTAGNDVDVWTRPEVAIVPNSGQKIWFEALVALASISVANGLFVGIANLSTMGAGLAISAASATKNSNLIGTSSGGQSMIGFWMHGDTLGNFDIIAANDITTALTPTTVGTASNATIVLANALTANANNPNPANLGYTPATAPGALKATTTATGIVSPNFVKLGLRYDGQQYIYFYVNGAQVAKLLVTLNAAVDQTSTYGGIVSAVAGTNAAFTAKLGFFRVASKLY